MAINDIYFLSLLYKQEVKNMYKNSEQLDLVSEKTAVMLYENFMNSIQTVVNEVLGVKQKLQERIK